MNNFEEKVNFIWDVANLLRGPYRPNQYKDIMLPLTVLRRLDCVLEPTKKEVLLAKKKWSAEGEGVLDVQLRRASRVPFYNTSRYTFEKLKGDPNNIADNLINYIRGFSARTIGIIGHFAFEEQIIKLERANRLFLIISKFCGIDLHPDSVSNMEMGYIFEELIRKFNEASNDKAGDHFTPREVIRLMVELIFIKDKEELTPKGIVKTLFDPACGTGGMLSVSEEYLHELNSSARLEVFGQDYNDQSFAICGSDMMIKGHETDHIAFGNSFTEDQFKREKFDYMLANPPFGVRWESDADFIKQEHDMQGHRGRFGAGLPSINDGSLLFLLHMISKMKSPKNGGTRLAIISNESPLFTGAAGSGESEIRRWIIENDWLEAIVALPDQLFYNTGIYTYLWIVTNRKKRSRKGKIQLIDGTMLFKKMRKPLNKKRHEICDDQRADLIRCYGTFKEGKHIRVFDNKYFGHKRITVERPLRLNFAVDHKRIAQLKKTKTFARLATSKKRKDTKAAKAEIEAGRKQQKKILGALKTLLPLGVIKKPNKFSNLMKEALKKAEIKVSAVQFEAIFMALSERDETAAAYTDTKGNPKPDPKLRDFEQIPLKEDINEYMKREVLLHVPDAWVNKLKTKIGYKINVTREFYQYTPPRSLKKIQADIKKIESEITDLIAEIWK